MTSSTAPADLGAAAPSAAAPISRGSVARWGALMAIALMALGALAIEEGLSQGGIITMTPVVTHLVEGLDGLTTGGWMIPAGLALLTLGGWLVHRALRPSPVVGLALRGSNGGFLTTRGMGRIAADAATDVSGVLDASAHASTRRVVVEYRGTGGSGISDQVRSAVTARLAALEQPPAVRASGKEHG